MHGREMMAELAYAAAMVLYGYIAMAGYQMLRLFRALFIHSVPMVDAEDILYLSGAGIGFFLVVYRMNDGILRWYAFGGGLIGVLLCEKTLGRLSAHVRKWILQKKRKPLKIKGTKKRWKKEVTDEGIACKSKQKK